jgi:hypothetical protein
MFKKVFAAAVLSLAVASGFAQNVCPCIPLSHVWVVTACETWNCAQSAMILANGDPYVVSIPTGGSKFKWVIARRVVAGTATVSPDDPFVVDSVPSAYDAAARFGAIAPDMLPVMLTTVDGESLLIRLRTADPQGRRRSAH